MLRSTLILSATVLVVGIALILRLLFVLLEYDGGLHMSTQRLLFAFLVLTIVLTLLQVCHVCYHRLSPHALTITHAWSARDALSFVRFVSAPCCYGWSLGEVRGARRCPSSSPTVSTSCCTSTWLARLPRPLWVMLASQ